MTSSRIVLWPEQPTRPAEARQPLARRPMFGRDWPSARLGRTATPALFNGLERIVSQVLLVRLRRSNDLARTRMAVR